jgi:hypothetical protein
MAIGLRPHGRGAAGPAAPLAAARTALEFVRSLLTPALFFYNP